MLKTQSKSVLKIFEPSRLHHNPFKIDCTATSHFIQDDWDKK